MPRFQGLAGEYGRPENPQSVVSISNLKFAMQHIGAVTTVDLGALTDRHLCPYVIVFKIDPAIRRSN
jgi:hypothetical protein